MDDRSWKRQGVDKDVGSGMGSDTSLGNVETKTTQVDSAAPSTTATSTVERIVQFNNSNFDAASDGAGDGTGSTHSIGDRVFSAYSGMRVTLFNWTVKEGEDITPKRVSLVEVVDDNGNDDDYKQIRYREFSTSSPGTSLQQSSQDQSSFFVDLSDKGVGLNLELFISDEAKRDKDSDAYLELNKVFAVDLEWGKTNSEDDGHSSSGYFSVMSASSNPDEEVKLQQAVEKFADASSGREDDGSDSDSPNDNVDPTGSDAPGSTNVSSGNDSGSGKGGVGGSGLSPGAIAGIAIGGFVFLCLIGLLVWFLLRRRSKNKSGYGGPGQDASNAYIVDKTDNSPHSPHSPYSDDGQGQQVPLDPAAAQHHRDQGAAAPYEEQQQRDLPRGEEAPGTQQGNTSRNYRHLVEEGMTEDDIRRLEEEERQLDAEIERADRR